MVLLSGFVLALGGILTYFTIGALAGLAHWISVAAGLLVFTGLSYNIIQNDYLDFDWLSEFSEAVIAVLFSLSVAAISFKLFESIFATLGAGAALVLVILLGASIVFSPVLVFNTVGGLIGALFEIAGGE